MRGKRPADNSSSAKQNNVPQSLVPALTAVSDPCLKRQSQSADGHRIAMSPPSGLASDARDGQQAMTRRDVLWVSCMCVSVAMEGLLYAFIAPFLPLLVCYSE